MAQHRLQRGRASPCASEGSTNVRRGLEIACWALDLLAVAGCGVVEAGRKRRRDSTAPS